MSGMRSSGFEVKKSGFPLMADCWMAEKSAQPPNTSSTAMTGSI